MNPEEGAGVSHRESILNRKKRGMCIHGVLEPCDFSGAELEKPRRRCCGLSENEIGMIIQFLLCHVNNYPLIST